MSTCSASIDAYLRVAAMSIALYDGLWTLPAEISLYREQKSFRQMTRACILFILIRYASIIVIVISNVGFFSSGFTASACQQFYLVSPSFKAIQTMVSQLILAARTVAVSRQNRYVMWTMWIMFSVTVALEFVSNIWRRVPFRMPPDSLHANCTSGNPPGHKVAWVHYLAAMLYDATCLSIATGFIYVQNRGQKGHTIDTLSKMLLKEGVVYFTFLTAANIFNLFLYVTATEQAQSAGATLGYATTWIMSQGLIIHLRQYKNTINSREIPRASSLPKQNQNSGFFVTTRPATDDDVELGVHVTIEENVKVDYDEDIISSLSLHRRIETECQRREERKKRQEFEGRREDTDGICQHISKGWEITSVGKIFSA